MLFRGKNLSYHHRLIKKERIQHKIETPALKYSDSASVRKRTSFGQEKFNRYDDKEGFNSRHHKEGYEKLVDKARGTLNYT